MTRVGLSPRLLIPSIALGLLLMGAPALSQTATLQNDGWVDNTAAGFEGGFITGEIGASVFYAESQDDYPVTLQKVRFLFGGEGQGEMYPMRIKVWNDMGGAEPGAQVFDEEFQLTSSTMAFNEVDLSQAGLVFTGPFRVGIEFVHAGFPGLARDDDGANNFPGRNLIYAIEPITMTPLGWVQSAAFGVAGDWIIRADVQTSGANPEPEPQPEPEPEPEGQPEPEPEPEPEGVPVVLNISAINPTEGFNDQDTDVTILGTGFGPTTTFRVGSKPIQDLLIQSPTAALGVVPAGIVPGTYDVIVNDQAAGTQAVLNSGFTVLAPSVPPAKGGDCSTIGAAAPAWSGLGLLLLGLVALVVCRRR